MKCSINHVNSIPFSHFLFIWNCANDAKESNCDDGGEASNE